MESTHSTEPTGDEPTSRLDRLRHWGTAVTQTMPESGRDGRVLTAAYVLLFTVNMTGIAAAQAGSNLCGTPIVQTVNAVAPLALAVVVTGGLIITYVLHAYSGFKKDPQKAKEVKDWRNRAGYGALSAPLVGKLLEIIIGVIGFGLAGCIDIIPGF
jgi:hypothetical protein